MFSYRCHGVSIYLASYTARFYGSKNLWTACPCSAVNSRQLIAFDRSQVSAGKTVLNYYYVTRRSPFNICQPQHRSILRRKVLSRDWMPPKSGSLLEPLEAGLSHSFHRIADIESLDAPLRTTPFQASNCFIQVSMFRPALSHPICVTNERKAITRPASDPTGSQGPQYVRVHISLRPLISC